MYAVVELNDSIYKFPHRTQQSGQASNIPSTRQHKKNTMMYGRLLHESQEHASQEHGVISHCFTCMQGCLY